MKRSRPAEASTNAADDSRGITRYNLPRTWQTHRFEPSPAVGARQLPANLQARAPVGLGGEQEPVLCYGAGTVCPRGREHCKTGREKGKESRGYCSVSNINWKTFQFLLPTASEVRNKTSRLPSNPARLLPACLGTGNAHVPGTRQLPRAVAERYRKTSVSAGVGNLLASLPKGSEGTPGPPGLARAAGSHAP